MSEPTRPRPRRGRQPNRAAQVGALIGMIIGVVGFQIVGPRYFPRPPEGGINAMQMVWAGLIGGVSAGVGAFIGSVIGHSARK